MGLIGDWVKSKRMKDPVRGVLQVTASTYPPDDATSGNFSINGVVSADGIPPTAVEHAGIARTRKWPRSGQTLPVTVDRADPTRLSIEWDEVPDSWETARQNAEALAASMQAQGGVTTTVTNLGGTTIDARGIPGLRDEVMKLATSGGSPAQIVDALRAHGIQVPDGTPVFTAGAQPPSEEEDPAERLKRLEALKRDGLVTEEEYAAQRARILGEL